LADRVLGQRRTAIIGAVLMAVGHFVMAFDTLFYPALVLLILGNGAFKPNISTQVGSLYEPGDPRRDRAFSIFYVGINLGACFSPLLCGTLGEAYGWHYGFGAAGAGMVIGLGIYLWGRRWLAPDIPGRQAVREEEDATGDPSPVGGDRRRILGLVAICVVVMLFWTAFEQQRNTIALWADGDKERHVFGWEIPAAYAFDGDGIPVSMFWLVGFNVVLTLGELYLSPVGLSLVTKMAPARMASMMMGVWFMAQFAGNYFAGYLGHFWDLWPKEQFFLMIAGVAGLSGLIILLLLKPLRRAMA
jgi:POT family proton-dependent oligopeptide transporter